MLLPLPPWSPSMILFSVRQINSKDNEANTFICIHQPYTALQRWWFTIKATANADGLWPLDKYTSSPIKLHSTMFYDCETPSILYHTHNNVRASVRSWWEECYRKYLCLVKYFGRYTLHFSSLPKWCSSWKLKWTAANGLWYVCVYAVQWYV